MGDKEFESTVQKANATLTQNVTQLASEVRILMNQKLARDEEDARQRAADNGDSAKKGASSRKRKDAKGETAAKRKKGEQEGHGSSESD